MNTSKSTIQRDNHTAPSRGIHDLPPSPSLASPTLAALPSSSASSEFSPPPPDSTLDAGRPTLKLNIDKSRLTTLLPLKLERDAGKNNNKAPSSIQNIKSQGSLKKTEENMKAQGAEDKATFKKAINMSSRKDEDKFKKEKMNTKNKMKPDEYFAILKSFQKKFPLTFTKDPKLLAVGIHRELIEASELGNSKLRTFLHIYCKSKKYRANCLEGTVRVNLKGEAAGTFDLYALENLKKHVKKRNEEKAMAKGKAAVITEPKAIAIEDVI